MLAVGQEVQSVQNPPPPFDSTLDHSTNEWLTVALRNSFRRQSRQREEELKSAPDQRSSLSTWSSPGFPPALSGEEGINGLPRKVGSYKKRA
jgi:hypothetical protein